MLDLTNGLQTEVLTPVINRQNKGPSGPAVRKIDRRRAVEDNLVGQHHSPASQGKRLTMTERIPKPVAIF
mgnify:CR=1 FL=1